MKWILNVTYKICVYFYNSNIFKCLAVYKTVCYFQYFMWHMYLTIIIVIIIIIIFKHFVWFKFSLEAFSGPGNINSFSIRIPSHDPATTNTHNKFYICQYIALLERKKKSLQLQSVSTWMLILSVCNPSSSSFFFCSCCEEADKKYVLWKSKVFTILQQRFSLIGGCCKNWRWMRYGRISLSTS